jgi:6-phosphofructokinase
MKSVANLLVAQSGGPTAVINSSLAGIVKAAQQSRRIAQIIGLNGGLEGLFQGRPPFDLSGLDEPQLEALRHSNGMALGSCRFRLAEEHYTYLLDFIRANQIGYFLYIGGNGSMLTPLELSRRAKAAGLDLRCVGIPKTVDNDLLGTDFAPGYPSAARWLTWATRDAGLDLAGMRGFDNVKIIEAMGRHSGWLAAATSLARSQPTDPPHLIYLPEIPFEADRFLQEVAQVYDREGVALVVVAEGIRDKEGRFVAEMMGLTRDETGRALFGFGAGAPAYLCNLIIEKLGLKARYDRPGTLQRGAACVSELDRQMAFEIGRQGVEFALEGLDGQMVGITRTSEPHQAYTAKLEPVALEKVAGRERLFPAEWIGPDGNPDWAAYRAYAWPLILPAPPEPARSEEFAKLSAISYQPSAKTRS